MLSSKIGRFDQSFIIHMIRDFFLLLILVISIELGIRFVIALYNFNHEGKLTTKNTAEHLASDIKSIMLNSGGPVAARTIYPVLKRNHEELGLEIAIIPSKKTISSMEVLFDFTPQGISPQWSTGRHHESTVRLRADAFCISCHVDAKVGEVLGHVTVRNYLSTKLKHWWEELRLTAMLGMGNILLHTTVLFFLLKFRMDQLLSLRSMVSLLARAGTKLSHRAEIKSHDEFGELALDLNLFLDRVSHIVEDLGSLLKKMIAINHRLNQLSNQMNERYKKVNHQLQVATAEAFSDEKEYQGLSEEGMQAIDLTLSVLQKLPKNQTTYSKIDKNLRQILIQYRKTFHEVEREFKRHAQIRRALVNLSSEFHEFFHFIGEFALLEEKMEMITETGQTLIQRLIDIESETSEEEGSPT